MTTGQGQSASTDVLREIRWRVAQTLLNHPHGGRHDFHHGGVHEIGVDVDLDEVAAIDRPGQHDFGAALRPSECRGQ